MFVSPFFFLICISIPLSEPAPTIVQPFHWFFTFLLSFPVSFIPVHSKMSSYPVGAFETQQLQPKLSSHHKDLMLCNFFFFLMEYFSSLCQILLLSFSLSFFLHPFLFSTSSCFFLSFIIFSFKIYGLFFCELVQYFLLVYLFQYLWDLFRLVWYFNGDFKLLIRSMGMKFGLEMWLWVQGSDLWCHCGGFGSEMWWSFLSLPLWVYICMFKRLLIFGGHQLLSSQGREDNFREKNERRVGREKISWVWTHLVLLQFRFVGSTTFELKLSFKVKTKTKYLSQTHC